MIYSVTQTSEKLTVSRHSRRGGSDLLTGHVMSRQVNRIAIVICIIQQTHRKFTRQASGPHLFGIDK